MVESYGKFKFNFMFVLQSGGWIIFTIPPVMYEHSNCSASPIKLLKQLVSLLIFKHSSEYVVVSHCSFNLIFLMTNDTAHPFFPIKGHLLCPYLSLILGDLMTMQIWGSLQKGSHKVVCGVLAHSWTVYVWVRP
jgi:hypothetical protein